MISKQGESNILKCGQNYGGMGFLMPSYLEGIALG